jgi:single-stranded-DNA-specific exonuclease
MGKNYSIWQPRSSASLSSVNEFSETILKNRNFSNIEALQYGDHGLESAYNTIKEALINNRKIALYADYDVDGTMSCVSWIWFFKAIGFDNYTHYIPDRFSEGYGLNLNAVKHLIDDRGAELIITMDTGITANAEAEYCKQRGVDFICTDHHQIQPEKMPDSIILNPKLHPDPDYQELCGCGITFVLLRKLGRDYQVESSLWTDLLALAGMATICDVVPLNPVNHRLAQMGVRAISRSDRPIFKSLLSAANIDGLSETDIGFRLGPRINAVGRLKHAKVVVEAFVTEEPNQLVNFMDTCNEERREIQKVIVDQALKKAYEHRDDPILFLGGPWHQGVVGIAASRVAEEFWRPTWLFCNTESQYKGSARSIPQFDVTLAMSHCKELWTKFGGHSAAGGYSFEPSQESAIREQLISYAAQIRQAKPDIWRSSIDYDAELLSANLDHEYLAAYNNLRPFGHGFEEPCLQITGIVDRVQILKDRKTQNPKHTIVHLRAPNDRHSNRIMFFNEVLSDLKIDTSLSTLVKLKADSYRGVERLQFIGVDFQPL